MKMIAKDVKEITNLPLVTFFRVLERPGKNRKGVLRQPPLVRRGLTMILIFPLCIYTTITLTAKHGTNVLGTARHSTKLL